MFNTVRMHCAQLANALFIPLNGQMSEVQLQVDSSATLMDTLCTCSCNM